MQLQWSPFQNLPTCVVLTIVDAIFNEYTKDIDLGYDEPEYDELEECEFSRFQVWKDVANLARTCKGFYALIAPVLYLRDLQWNYASDLLLSAKNGSLAGVLKSLEHGADVDQQDHSTLHVSSSEVDSRWDDENCVWYRWYCSKRRSMNIFLTALHWAAIYRHPQVVETLLQRGADINLEIDFGDTELHPYHGESSARTFYICGSLSQLPVMGAGITFRNLIPSGQTRHLECELHNLLSKGGNALYCALLNSEGFPFPEKEYGKFCLLSAKLLVDAGSSLITYPAIGLHALHQACGNWSFEAADFLLTLDRVGIDPNVRDAFGNTPMHYLVMGSSSTYNEFPEALARLLLHHGADINAINHAGYLPLHYFSSGSYRQDRKAALWLCREGSHVFPGFIEYFQTYFHGRETWRSKDLKSVREVDDILFYACQRKEINTAGLRSSREMSETERNLANVWLFKLWRHHLADIGNAEMHEDNGTMDPSVAGQAADDPEVESWNSGQWDSFWAAERHKLSSS